MSSIIRFISSSVIAIEAEGDEVCPLTYAPVEQRFPGEGYPALFVRATQGGINRMVETLKRLEAEERWVLNPISEAGVYRSTFSGWKLLSLLVTLAIQRMRRQ